MRRSTLAVLFTLLSLTAVSPSHAHAYALKTTLEGTPVRWQQPDVTLRIDASVTDRIGTQAARAAAEIATEAWRGLEGVPDVTIAAGAPAAYDAAHRNNGIYLLNDWPFEDDQLAMTITTFTPSGAIVGVDILLNGERSFEMLSEPHSELDDHAIEGGAHDLAAVLTHEVGHALGLAHSEDDRAATMWPNIRGGETHQRTLSEDDERGIEDAYAAPMTQAQLATTACTVSPGHTQKPTNAAFFSLLGLSLAFVARRRRA